MSKLTTPMLQGKSTLIHSQHRKFCHTNQIGLGRNVKLSSNNSDKIVVTVDLSTESVDFGVGTHLLPCQKPDIYMT